MERRTTCQPADRTGLTIIEVLVAIGILGLLAAILMPAIQQSRMTARQIACASHLRQIGLAAQQYHETFLHLPGKTLLYHLFPYLDLQAWFAAGFSQQDIGKRHEVLLCPLDALHDIAGSPSPYSYLVSGGGCWGCGEGMERFGPANQRGVSWRDVTDGLSATAFLSERRASLSHTPVLVDAAARRAACEADPVRCVWKLGAVYGPGQDASFAADCLDASRRSDPTFPEDVRAYWNPVGRPYLHVLPPNAPSCFRGYEFETSHPLGATSHHHGGVNLLLCDGSARFVSDSISLPTWWAIGTRAGNDAVGEF
ncbi:MAG TPA: DUF1559 domain-containing protein [Caulifigura sp.]|nr:DUF1559 domain-containing protein [Caulifigura sp.]